MSHGSWRRPPVAPSARAPGRRRSRFVGRVVTFLVVVASSAHADPAAPSLSEARPVGETVIDFRGDPSVTLWSRPRGAAGEFRPLCVAPCTARLPPGAHALALSHDDGSPRDADTVVAGGYTTMTGAYESRGLLRAGGIVLGLTSLLLGAYLLATSVQPIACPNNVKCADAGPDPAHNPPCVWIARRRRPDWDRPVDEARSCDDLRCPGREHDRATYLAGALGSRDVLTAVRAPHPPRRSSRPNRSPGFG